MIRWTNYPILMVALALFACTSSERRYVPLAQDENSQLSDVVQGEPTASDLPKQSTSITGVAPKIIVRTDRDLYRQGESMLVTIENNSAKPIHFLEICSMHLCLNSGEEWICEERECDGSMTVLESRGDVTMLQEAKSLIIAADTDSSLRYKLDYQVVAEDPFYFAHSNAFTILNTGANCQQAKEIALEHAQSSPNLNSIDASRATVRWQGENKSCMVDFAWQDAGQIHTGLWAEGYQVTVDARSGQVIEANAYER